MMKMVWNQFSVAGHFSYIWYQQLCNHVQMFWVSCWFDGNYTFWVSVIIYLLCFFLAGFNLISFLISFSVFQGSVLDLLFNSYRACFFRVKWSKDKISIINHMYQLCYLTIVDSETHGKSKRTWNFLEVIPLQSLLCHLFQVKVNKEMWRKQTHFFPTQTLNHCLQATKLACAQNIHQMNLIEN